MTHTISLSVSSSSLHLPFSLLPSLLAVFWNPLNQRPRSTSYPWLVGFTQPPSASSTHPKFKADKRKSSCGKSQGLYPWTLTNLLIMTPYYFSLSLCLPCSLPPFLLCASFFFLLVYLTAPFALCPFSSTMVVSPRSRSFCSSASHVKSLPLLHSTSPYCRAFNEYTGKVCKLFNNWENISPTPLSLVRSKNRFMLGMNHSQLLDMEMLIVPS